MHELSIAQSIIDIANEYLDDPEVNQIHEIEIEIGMLSGAEKDALEFAMEATIKGTKLGNTTIIYQQVIGKAACLSCSHHFDLENLLSICPKCGGMHHKILDGKQLRIKSLKIT